MKSSTFIIAFTLLFGLSSFTFLDNVMDQPERALSSQDNQYKKYRRLAFDLTPGMLGLEIPENKEKLYGIIAEWDIGGGTIATLAVFLNGEASMYMDNGATFIGDPTDESIKNLAVNFIQKGESYLKKATKSEEITFPDKGLIKFYFMTNKGRHVAQEEVEKLGDETSEWLDLFNEADKVMTELRAR